jgi:hypothetical protein
MPIALDGDTVDVCLDSDKDKPEATRPVFVCRYLTCRQAKEYDNHVRESLRGDDASAQAEAVNKALAIAIVGQRNMTGEIDDLLTFAEKWELAMKIPTVVQLSELDKKKSRSKPQSDGANSATSATAESATIAPPLTPPTS